MSLNLNYPPKLKCKVTKSSFQKQKNEFYQIDELDDAGFDFVKKCVQVIERRGLDEQGLYRVVGMQSKVNSIVAGHFGKFYFL